MSLSENLSYPMLLLGAGYVAVKIYGLIKCKPLEQQSELNDVLFFPDQEFPCSRLTSGLSVRANCFNPACRRLHGRPGESKSSMLKFLTILESAQTSVDVCIFIFTQSNFADVLCGLINRGVSVRVLTDSGEEAAGSQIKRLSNYGALIRSNKMNSGALMHHKFVLIDGKILMTGSFNWTNKAVVSNYEAVIVTTCEWMVKAFKTQFNEMWLKFHPLKPELTCLNK